jgi:hypothetical protein
VKHCDDYITDQSQPLALRRFLRFHRWPAYYQLRALDMGLRPPVLFATNTEGKRVRVVMASRFGDVGITAHLDAERGYDVRVPVAALTDFGSER